jgi:hypothetical protein
MERHQLGGTVVEQWKRKRCRQDASDPVLKYKPCCEFYFVANENSQQVFIIRACPVG